MKFGLTDKELLLLQNSFSAIKDKFKIKVCIFGSRAKGNYKKFSDIDILIRTTSPTNEIKQEILKIEEELVEGSLPYKVDIVIEGDIAKSYKQDIDTNPILDLYEITPT